MFTSICSGAVNGIDGQLVVVEADITEGFPTCQLVGYLASEVKEARERVTSALKNSGYCLPAKRMIINLSPAGVRKQGTAYDLPIALAMLGSLGVILPEYLEGVFAVGELSLDGSLRPVKGILPMILMAGKQGLKKCIVPASNVREARLAQWQKGCTMEIIGLESLGQVLEYLTGASTTGICEGDKKGIQKETQKWTREGIQDGIREGAREGFREPADDWREGYGYRTPDFSEILGQDLLKRAIVVAVSGMHHLLMIGAPGSGKSMSARAIQGILPPMTFEESLEVTRLYSVAGILGENCALVTRRPFRSPHHTVPLTTMTGGGRIPVPGEISLAHRGILFLDELAEFAPATLEILREPLEEGVISVNRLQGSVVYPADFMLVAAMNPCKCGYFPDKRRCRCTSRDVSNYLHRISRPLWNRIDVCVEVHPPDPVRKKKNKDPAAIGSASDFGRPNRDFGALDSAAMAAQVYQAREIQRERFQKDGIYFNSRMSVELIDRYCCTDRVTAEYADELAQKLDLTMRGKHKLLRLARTVADVDGCEQVREEHLDEAAGYRMIERTYWEYA